MAAELLRVATVGITEEAESLGIREERMELPMEAPAKETLHMNSEKQVVRITLEAEVVVDMDSGLMTTMGVTAALMAVKEEPKTTAIMGCPDQI